MKLVSHEPFVSRQTAIEKEIDIHSTMVVQMRETTRKRVADTDTGLILKQQIKDLKNLLAAYNNAKIKEKF
jgi:fructose-1,6-bisphosphatase-3